MENAETELPLHYYQSLAEFRYRIRRFIRFTEKLARSKGIEPQQHQLLLAVKGLPPGKKATIGELAERLQLQHHSVVELVDRLAEHHYIERQRDRDDQRRVLVHLTNEGEAILQEISVVIVEEMRYSAPLLVKALSTLLVQEGMVNAEESPANLLLDSLS